jgi:predicted secreted protein
VRLDDVPPALHDARGGKVVFVAHCILNQNVRYLGGAFRCGAVDEVIDAFRRDGIGICQLPCPEQAAWGGALKPLLLTMFGSRGSLRERIRRPLLALFGWYTRLVYRRLARTTARQIADYVRSGFTVVGVVGIADSPSCGVHTTMDLPRALEAAVDVPVAALTRTIMNERIVAANVKPGTGWFVDALRRELRRRHLAVPFLELDPAAAMTGAPARLRESEELHV